MLAAHAHTSPRNGPNKPVNQITKMGKVTCKKR